MNYEDENVMAFGDSDITHLYADGLVKHVIYRTFILNNVKEPPSFENEGFVFVETEQEKISNGEYDAYFSGRKYIHKYIKYLD